MIQRVIFFLPHLTPNHTFIENDLNKGVQNISLYVKSEFSTRDSKRSQESAVVVFWHRVWYWFIDET